MSDIPEVFAIFEQKLAHVLSFNLRQKGQKKAIEELLIYFSGIVERASKAESRIAELEAEKSILEDQQREAKNILIDKKLQIDSLYEEGYKMQQRIAELEAERRWIPVSERLPEEKQKILITWAPKYSQIFSAIFGTGFTDWTFTHWMPLPEPPEVTE